MVQQNRITIPQRVGDPEEVDYSLPAPTDVGELARDRIPVRSLREADLKALESAIKNRPKP